MRPSKCVSAMLKKKVLMPWFKFSIQTVACKLASSGDF